ncbi:hypothetical protein [Bacillus suaedaesalsae]|uniref:Uncharacterized protein n=1 Tax=Bacillus suaedaesalsae TaxID=2810349 RepID=A0ABS2DKE1_9BACI|nr:hypothetical protein [Bacillus suaedaesalsae]MBM6618969.1 hypothetical protein [Bacillus suaedaesalsae]
MNYHMYHHLYNQNLFHYYNSYPYRHVNPDEFTTNQWVQYMDPLVQRALQEVNEGINLTHLFQEFILSGVLVGRGYTPEQAIEQVEQWEKAELSSCNKVKQ